MQNVAKLVRDAIKVGNLSNKDLDEIILAVRYARSQLASDVKKQLQVGQTVKFVSSRDNREVIGRVVKINQKTIVVDDFSRSVRWRVCSAAMLEIV